ncbi:MAG TPA: membrane protein insertion efficiency factor YidD [Thermoanaerobaculia bacterium]
MGRGQKRRTLLIAGAALLVALMIHDFAVPPGRSYSARAAVAAIDQYRAHVSGHLKGRVFCRFQPTCSAYGREVFRKYGFAVGAWKTTVRLARCGPWTPMGTVDLP